MSNLTFNFAGRTILVTGAAHGIGYELGRFFQASGAATFLLDVDADALAQAAGGTGASAVEVDVTDTRSVESAVASAVRDTGRVDVIVNNAGILRDGWLWKQSDEDWDAVLSVHAGGTFRMTRACVPHFRSQSFGRVINVTSYTGLRGNTGQANYATAKAGIVGFTKTAAKELAPFGITVNAISPNAETRMMATLPDLKRQEFLAANPMKRIADPTEMCVAVGFLASEEAGYITGAVLPVDGGHSI
jgi:3-oxoacyl-[acyl-carrier protein] reductase